MRAHAALMVLVFLVSLPALAGDLYVCKDYVITDTPGQYTECVNNRTKVPYEEEQRARPAPPARQTAGSGKGSGSETVLKAQFGSEWPLTVDYGTIACGKQGAQRVATFIAPGGKRYGLNGTAQSRGYPPIDPIWRENPDIPGTKVLITQLLQAALKLCG